MVAGKGRASGWEVGGGRASATLIWGAACGVQTVGFVAGQVPS